jgi:hypothetical protein
MPAVKLAVLDVRVVTSGDPMPRSVSLAAV